MTWETKKNGSEGDFVTIGIVSLLLAATAGAINVGVS